MQPAFKYPETPKPHRPTFTMDQLSDGTEVPAGTVFRFVDRYRRRHGPYFEWDEVVAIYMQRLDRARARAARAAAKAAPDAPPPPPDSPGRPGPDHEAEHDESEPH
eukprot:1706647-Alexandrium_andersonii.AAC.1